MRIISCYSSTLKLRVPLCHQCNNELNSTMILHSITCTTLTKVSALLESDGKGEKIYMELF